MNIDKEIARKIWTDARSKFDKIPYRVDTDFELYWMEQQEQVKNCSIPAVVGQSEQFKCDCGCTNHYKNEIHDSVMCAYCGTVYARI